MKEVQMINQGGGKWVCESLEDLQTLSKFEKGDTVLFKPRNPRNLGHHRKLFKMLQFARLHMREEHQQLYRNEEELLDDLKLATGHFDVRHTATGKKWYKPKSIAFESMDQDEFKDFYDACLDKLCQVWFAKVDKNTILDELLTFG